MLARTVPEREEEEGYIEDLHPARWWVVDGVRVYEYNNRWNGECSTTAITTTTGMENGSKGDEINGWRERTKCGFTSFARGRIAYYVLY